MARLIGTVVALDPYDALGWIELDGGGRVRFGGSALKGFRAQPGVGTRVEVRGTTPGFQGATKAVMVVPLAPSEPPPPPGTPWPTFVRDHPRFSDAADTSVPFARPLPPLSLPPNALFAPWQREIEDTAPVVVALGVPHASRLDPIEAHADLSFAHGRVAFLDEPRWPTCGVCARPLEMCLQLAPSVLADWLPGGGGLAVAFCFHCGASGDASPEIAHVRLVTPRHRVERPAVTEPSASSGWHAQTQRVRVAPPRRALPSTLWYRYRSEHAPTLAASALFGYEALDLAGPSPSPDLDALDRESLRDAYDDWVEAASRSSDPWDGGHLGGVARWDQADATPRCTHGEMQHLLDYGGGQFLDGALHVFVCRARACEQLAWVAEF